MIEDADDNGACLRIDPAGFHLKPSPAPHHLSSFITPDEALFETIHMGAAVVDNTRWQLCIDGLVKHPLRISLAQLMAMPAVEVTAIHECFGSPLAPPVDKVMRMGNVCWRGVPLGELLKRAGLEKEAAYIWSFGLDFGQFGGRQLGQYQKDLPVEKALADEVIVAYAMNGEPLRKERGGPVRLVVPGYYGTNSTKWLWRLSARASRADGPFTTIWYNEGGVPAWSIKPNSIMTKPPESSVIQAGNVVIEGWSWSSSAIVAVDVSIDNGHNWQEARVEPRSGLEWQAFRIEVMLQPGNHTLICRARNIDGEVQPLAEGRNQVHRLVIATV